MLTVDYSSALIYGVAILCIVFFGLTGIIGVKKLFDPSPGLIINADGITDNSSGVSAGLIPWNEITDIKRYKIQRNQFVSIFVDDPEKYINRGNAIQKATNKANFKLCGTPINISANSLKISYEQLFSTIEGGYLKQKQNA